MSALNELTQFPTHESLQHILLVTDDQSFRFAHSNLLAHEGRSIDEPIVKLRDGTIDLLILDMTRPDASVFDFRSDAHQACVLPWL